MQKETIRKMAAALSSVLMFSSVGLIAGCNRHGDAGSRVADDAVWYDTVKLELESPYEDLALNYGMMHEPVYVGDYLFVLVTGEKRFNYDEALSDPDFDFNDYVINSVLKYDLEGTLVEEIDFGSDLELDNFQVDNMSEYDGKLKISATASEAGSWTTDSYCVIYNPESGEVESSEPSAVETDFGTYLETVVKVGDYEVNFLRVDDIGGTNYQLVITSGNEVVNTIDVAEETGFNFWDINFPVAVDDDTLVVKCYSDDDIKVGTLKVSTGEFTLADSGMEKLEGYSFSTDQNGKAFAVDTEGIWKINSSLEVEPLLAFTDTYINANIASTGQVAYCQDDMAILFVEDFAFDGTLADYYVYLITKAETNPNAGKSILDVYVMSNGLSYSEAEGVLQFNITNEEYFAQVRFADIDITLEDEEKNSLLNDIANQLIVDIGSGNGPDVVLDGASFLQLNNSECFADLNAFIDGDNGINKSEYFYGIIENAAASDGALYQMPISYSVGGILAYRSDVGDGRVGFTFDEYNQFVDIACNGNNPIRYNQVDFVADCIARGYVNYMTDGRVDFDTPEFVALAEYADQYILDEIVTEEESDFLILDFTNPIASGPADMIMTDPESFVYQVSAIDEAFGMYGYPGLTGEDGPAAYINSSAAISAEISEDKQGVAWDFIKTMISEDVQKLEDSGNLINVAAFTYCAQSAVDSINTLYDSYLDLGIDEAELAIDGMQRTDEAIVGYLVDIASSVTSVSYVDTSVRMIVYEEIPAYFAGQKDLPTVIQTINDRVQLLVDERGLEE